MAEVLQIPLGTVKSRMNQMTQRLRDDLARRLSSEPRAGSGPPAGESPEPEKEYPAHALRNN
jgi:hypothetical protein